MNNVLRPKAGHLLEQVVHVRVEGKATVNCKAVLYASDDDGYVLYAEHEDGSSMALMFLDSFITNINGNYITIDSTVSADSATKPTKPKKPKKPASPGNDGRSSSMSPSIRYLINHYE